MDYIESAISIIKKINNNGYDAYIVGGAVRDYLLKMPLNDIDLTTNMPLDEVKHLFNTLDTGVSYLGVTIVENGYSFEITEFRRDIKYEDNRHPEVEKVSTYYEDSFRRDFTINALALDADMKVIDYHGGIDDINNKLIRAIGNPDTRFKEDSLRILRALHYASKTDFDIEENTLKAIINNKGLLCNLSDDRVFAYIKKLNDSTNKKGIEYINKYDLFSDIIEYKKMISLLSYNVISDDIPALYYLKFNDFPRVSKTIDKRKAKAIKEILDNNMSNYIIFKYYDTIIEYFSLLKVLGCDIIKLGKSRDSLIIKSTKDLAVDTKIITDSFDGNMKAVKLKEVIEGILSGKIKNNEKSIMDYIRSNSND